MAYGYQRETDSLAGKRLLCRVKDHEVIHPASFNYDKGVEGGLDQFCEKASTRSRSSGA